MDRPSFTFMCYGGHWGMVGTASPLRPYEKAFRNEGFPLYVHDAPGGPISGDLLEQTQADIRDADFLQKFQAGLERSQRFRDLNIAKGKYSDKDDEETVAQKLCMVDVSQLSDLSAVIGDPKAKPFDVSTPQNCARFFLMKAMDCSAVLNYALDVSTRNGVTPLSDARPYSSLVSSKYARAIGKINSQVGSQVPATDISFAILDEAVPSQTLDGLTVPEILRYRKESTNAREAFLEYVSSLQARLGRISAEEDYASSISRIINAEVKPAAREFRNKLQTMRENLFGSIAKDALAGIAATAGLTGGLEVFGDLSWATLLSAAAAAASGVGSLIGKAAIDALIQSRAIKRECALSYVLELES